MNMLAAHNRSTTNAASSRRGGAISCRRSPRSVSPPVPVDIVSDAPPERSLLRAVAAGRPDALTACVRQFSPHLWSLARGILRNVHDIEDAVQDVLLELWRVADRYDPTAGSELTFVLTIARRRFIDAARRVRRATPVDPESSLADTQAAESTDQVAMRDEFARVSAAVRELRPEHRSVLEQSLLQGHTHTQIAQRTGLPIGTVKSHARRGLMKLRETLGLPPSGDAPAGSDRNSSR